jgi:hypothetical protein
MKKLTVAILTLVVLIVTSCDDTTAPCIEEKPTASIIKNFPDSINVVNTHKLKVSYILENSCGKFDRFDVISTDKSYEVQMITKYEGCNCSLEFSEEETEFEINLDFPGVYEFKFWQADNDFDIRTVTIFE